MKSIFTILASNNFKPIDPVKDIGYNPTIRTADTGDILNLMNVVYMVAGIVAVIVIIIAGFTFITSSGDQAKITKAKNTILYASVGLVVVMVAFTVTQFILFIF